MTDKSQDWPGLGFDPAPGAAHVIDNLVNNMAKLARHLHEVHDVMDRIKSGKDDTWTGEAADAFKKKLGELPGYLRDASEGAAKVRRALHGWHQTLVENQSTSRDLETRAKAARDRYEKAQVAERSARSHPDLGLRGKYFVDGAELQEANRRYKAANDRLDEAVSKLDSAHSELNDLIRRAHSLEDDHKSVARAKERAIREAADSTADPDWNDFKDWWGAHGGDVLGVVGGVLGVAAIFCPVLAPFAILASLAALGQHTYQYASEGTLWPPQKHASNYITLGGDLIGTIPGAKLVGMGAKAAISDAGGIRSLLSASEGMSHSAKLEQGMRVGNAEMAGNYERVIEKGAQEAPWAVEKSVGWIAARKGWDEGLTTAAERGATAGAMGTFTAAQMPSLGSDADAAGVANTAGGGYGNALSTVGGGLRGTAGGIASLFGVGAVATGLSE